jgi:agmatine deiminase
MKRAILPVFALIIAACSQPKDKPAGVRWPGEFEPQQAVWLCWDGDSAYNAVSVSMLRALLPHVSVRMAVANDSLLNACKTDLARSGVDASAIEFHTIPGVEYWMRDCGATYVLANDSLRAVDFTWDTYAYRDWLIALFEGDTLRADTLMGKTSAVGRGTSDSLCARAEGTPLRASWFRTEGGAIESNGQGTLIITEPLALQRNHGVSKDSMAHELERVLGVTNIIWLPQGVAEDPHMWQTIAPGYFSIGCGGHTDEYVRFADAHTILLAWVPENEKDANPVNRVNYERMNANYAVLAKAMDQQGEPFHIVKVPLPDPRTRPTVMLEAKQWDDSYNVPVSAFRKQDGWAVGDSALRVASASYMNFLVTNDVVLLPSYVAAGSSREKEEEVKRIFSEAFPGRKLIMLDDMILNWEGGGIHCGTQQVPKHTR